MPKFKETFFPTVFEKVENRTPKFKKETFLAYCFQELNTYLTQRL